MKQLSLYLIILSFSILMGCGAKKGNAKSTFEEPIVVYQSHILDSILQKGLDNEALFTLLGNLKPMSSLVYLNYPIANGDSAMKTSGEILDRGTHGVYLDRLQNIQHEMNKMSLPDLRITMLPFKGATGTSRTMQINVVRVSSLDRLLQNKESFFGQFGLVPGTDPSVVVSTIENADRYERLRGYGYLFGYPDYAIEFFVDAAVESDSTKKVRERNFFRIPTFARVEGNFVYAYPKDQEPLVSIDSVIYHQGVEILDNYRSLRNNYLTSDSTIQAYRLLQDFYRYPRAKTDE